MNWNLFFLVVDVVLSLLFGLLFLFGVIRLFWGLRQVQKGPASEPQKPWYDYTAVIQGMQALLLALFGGCFLIENHLSDFFPRILIGIVGLACGFFYILSLPRVRMYASPRRSRPAKKREVQQIEQRHKGTQQMRQSRPMPKDEQE